MSPLDIEKHFDEEAKLLKSLLELAKTDKHQFRLLRDYWEDQLEFKCVDLLSKVFNNVDADYI